MPDKILIVIPPCFVNRELDFEIGLPVHLALLGREARAQGWLVDYLDMTLEEKEGYDSFSALEGRLEDGNIRVVGVSNHTVRTSVTTRVVAERVKSLRPDVKVVVGGVNSTFMWRELLTRCLAIDYVLRGYAQPGIRALLACLRSGSEASGAGLVSRRNGELFVEPMIPVTSSDFSTPSVEDLDVSRYLDWTTTYPLLTHTGCGFSCNFCTSVMPGPYQNREVYRPTDDIVAEMLQAIELGFERFFMSANIFTSQRDWCMDICRAMQEARIPERATWVCMTRVEFVERELLCTMRDAGCINIAFGVETASPQQWKSLRKGRFSEDVIRKAFGFTKEAGIGTTAYLMLGTPTQTQEDIETTIDLIRNIDPTFRVVSFFQPFPGTPYWEDPERFGLSEISPLEEWNFHEGPICRTKYLDKKALWEAAVRLQLDRSESRPLVPALDGLDHTPSASTYAETALEQYVLGLLDSSTPISEILEYIAISHGPRARLIALYWLSSGIRSGVINRRPHLARIDKQISGFVDVHPN